MTVNIDGMELVRYEWDPRTGVATFVYERNGTELQPMERVQLRHWTSPAAIERENRLENERYERRRARRVRARTMQEQKRPEQPAQQINPEIW